MTCRYPIGDPLKPDFRFCCQQAVRKDYCEEHFKLCCKTDFTADPNWNGKKSRDFVHV